MSADCRKIIEKYVELIDNNKFDRFYFRVWKDVQDNYDVGYITTLLRQCDIQPLDYLTNIPKAYMFDQPVTDVTIPDHIVYIFEKAFSYCEQLRSIDIPEGVLELGDDCFYGCYRLTRVKLPLSLKYIGAECFGSTGLNDIFYNGTFEQWQDISIDSYGAFPKILPTLHCIDGDYILDG